MPSLTLARDWDDPAGTRHRAGERLEVDDITATRLAAGGYVVGTDPAPASVEPIPHPEPA